MDNIRVFNAVSAGKMTSAQAAALLLRSDREAAVLHAPHWMPHWLGTAGMVCLVALQSALGLRQDP